MTTTKWDVEFEFDVGSSEKHHVSFAWGQAWGEASVNVDGREVLREKHPFGIKKIRRYEVPVGDSEVHSVVIEKQKPVLAGGVRKQTFRVLVDGDLLGEY
jgi:hypothetical protein